MFVLSSTRCEVQHAVIIANGHQDAARAGVQNLRSYLGLVVEIELLQVGPVLSRFLRALIRSETMNSVYRTIVKETP